MWYSVLSALWLAACVAAGAADGPTTDENGIRSIPVGAAVLIERKRFATDWLLSFGRILLPRFVHEWRPLGSVVKLTWYAVSRIWILICKVDGSTLEEIPLYGQISMAGACYFSSYG